MSFPRYPKYKDSGVEWLGDVPEGWEIERIKATVSECRNGIWGDEPNGDEWDIACLRVADFDRDRLRVCSPVPTLRNVGRKERQGRMLRPGDLLLEKSGGGDRQPVGCVALVEIDEPAVCSNFVARMSLAAGFDSSFCRYLHAAMYALRLTTRSINQTSGIQNLDQQAYLNEPVALPTLEEQIAIARFLEKETAKIDALVEEQRRLIELLEEKRQAVISHAVTKGLDPAVPIKSTGLEWLTQMPAHWTLRKFSHLFRASKGKRGQLLTKEYCGEHTGPYPVYSGQTAADGVMGSIDEFEFEFPEPGVLFATTVGAKAMHLKQVAGRFSLSQNCMIVWPNSTTTEVPFYFYHCQPLFSYEREMIPDHMQASFRMEDLYSYEIAVPPIGEQKLIVQFLAELELKIELLREEAVRNISLLQERRSALISAAVTGKIDVRNYKPQSSAAAEETHEPA